MYKLKRQNLYSFSLLLLFIAYTFSVSCVSLKKAKYFSDLPDTITSPALVAPVAPFTDPKIEVDDILAITLQTVTQSEGNAPITSSSGSVFQPLNGFLVDKNGYVELALIGFVKVAGLTTSEARELIKQRAKEFYNNPVVNLRISNFNIIVLGEVGHPGTITMPNEKVSILDAIALSGDLPLTAKRDNILLIRTIGNEKKFVRLDLNSSKIFQSEYFYLKQRDVIYVEPNNYKIQSADNTFTKNWTFLTSIVSFVSLFFIIRSNIK